MKIELNVQAEVIDITTDNPQPNESFLVDTNVWLWQTYSRFSEPQLSRSDFGRFSDTDPRKARNEAEKVQNKIAKNILFIINRLICRLFLDWLQVWKCYFL